MQPPTCVGRSQGRTLLRSWGGLWRNWPRHSSQWPATIGRSTAGGRRLLPSRCKWGVGRGGGASWAYSHERLGCSLLAGPGCPCNAHWMGPTLPAVHTGTHTRMQECVGRLGSFPYGIDIVTAADYFSVSVRSAAYLEVATHVAALPGYLAPLAAHLQQVKSRHWEKGLRELTARALAALVPLGPERFMHSVLPAMLVQCTAVALEARHGAVAAVAELLPALRCGYVHACGGVRMRCDVCWATVVVLLMRAAAAES
jgi:hypothetical protein